MISHAAANTIYLYPDADTFISSDNPDHNYGDEVVIWVGKSNSGGFEEARIRFSGIPAGATINSATLRLYRYTGIGAFTLAVQSASQSWSENTLTWHTEGSKSRWPTPISTYYVSDTTGYLSVDVTTHVQEWANGTRSNYGFHLTVNKPSEVNPGTQSLFYSRERPSTSDKPRLEINYTINMADLKATWFYVKSWTVKEGDSFYIYTDVKNEGSYAAGASHARLYLSLDNDRDVSDDYEVTPKKYVPPLDVGEIANPRWDFQFPNLSDDPTYNVWLICVVDCDDEVPELNENNIFPCAGGLTVTNLTPQRGSLQFKSPTYTVAENAGSIRIYVSRTDGSYGSASVNYATANGTATAGSDYTAKSGTLSWSDGDAADKYFDVSITNDSTPENDETFTANLSGASGASQGSPNTTTVTIVDDEPVVPVVSIVASDDAGEPADDGYFTVSRTGSKTGILTVYYGTSGSTATGGSDYVALTGSVNILDGQPSASIPVDVIDDSLVEGPETVKVTLSSNAAYDIDPSKSYAIVTITDDDGSKLNGLVIKLDAQGQAAGPLAGATVTITGVGTKTSDTSGNFQFANLNPDNTYTVTVSKAGYYSVTRSVTIKARETKQETFNLSIQIPSESPTAYNVDSPNGKHFIERMPGSLSFSVEVAWNGSPGSVSFTVAGNRHTATITDLGRGKARATLTLAAPSIINTCSELTIEVVNGEGKRINANTGIRFHPMPGIVPLWYRDNIPWTPSGLSLTYSDQTTATNSFLPENLHLGPFSIESYHSVSKKLSFNLMAGKFDGDISWSLGADFKTGYNPVFGRLIRGLGEVEGNLGGGAEISLAGCESPRLTPYWQLGFSGKVGIGVPTVLFVEVIIPPVAPAIHFLLSVPVVCDVVGALETRFYVVFGMDWRGQYPNGKLGDNPLLLWAKTVEGEATVGIEIQSVLDLYGAYVGVYGGGTATLPIELPLRITKVRAYVGAFAKIWLFEYKQEIGAEIEFDSAGETMVLGMAELPGAPAGGSWKPIGIGLSRYGEANRLANSRQVWLLETGPAKQSGTFIEEKIAENVVGVANPSIIADGSRTLVLFCLRDTSKPWYESTDIGVAQRVNSEPWLLDRISNDSVAEFNPKVIPVDSHTAIATWERISGDVSDAIGPGDILPHLDVATSWLDRDTGLWSTPIQLTSNNIVDREPLPVVFGAKRGIVWIQNQADASPGNATNGDRLMYAEWLGTSWSEPNALWSAKKGIIGVAFTADASGKGYIVFAVDEDGDPNSKTDRELYKLSTANGVWQSAIRLTNNVVEDTLPVLVAPNGSATCVWDANGTLTYTPLANWNPKSVYTEYTLANQAPCLDGITMPGGAAVAYTVQTESGVDIFASFYDAGLDRWSLPRRLTNDEHAESALSLTCDGANLVIAYLKTQTERNDIDIEIGGEIQHLKNIPQPGRTDLCLLRHTLGNDLAASSMIIEPSNPAPVSAATITATIENRGDIPLQGAEVAFYDGNPNNGGAIIGNKQIISETLNAGGTKKLSVIWDIPADANSHELFVVADPCMSIDDRDRSNNTVSTRAVLPDLLIDSCRSTDVSGTTVALTATVLNAGVIPAGAFEISWRLGSANGEQIGTSTLESLGPEESYEVTYIWDMADRIFSDEYIRVFAVADPANVVSEFNENNNLYSMTVVCKTVYVSIFIEHIGYDRQTGRFGVDVTVTNESEAAIMAPLWLVIKSISAPSVTLADSNGITPDGKPYIDLSKLLGDGQLDPGESITKQIYFNNPEGVRFTFEPSVRSVILQQGEASNGGLAELARLSGHWLGNEPSLDVAPPGGDGIVNFLDFAVLSEQ
jgi:hypothetical protein